MVYLISLPFPSLCNGQVTVSQRSVTLKLNYWHLIQNSVTVVLRSHVAYLPSPLSLPILCPSISSYLPFYSPSSCFPFHCLILSHPFSTYSHPWPPQSQTLPSFPTSALKLHRTPLLICASLISSLVPTPSLVPLCLLTPPTCVDPPELSPSDSNHTYTKLSKDT